MNRKNLISLIILDVVVMLLAFGLVLFRYNSLSQAIDAPTHTASIQDDPGDSPLKAIRNEEPTVKQDIPLPEATAAENETQNQDKRNIGFSFRNSRAKKVQVIGDFNDWIPQSMVKGANHTWKITLPLAPGEYAYNIVVDGRPIRDPNNPKACNIGRGFQNSFLKVKPLPINEK